MSSLTCASMQSNLGIFCSSTYIPSSYNSVHPHNSVHSSKNNMKNLSQIYATLNLNSIIWLVPGSGWGVGGGGGGGVGNLIRDNFGTGVRASISKPTPFIYLAFKKTDPFIYLIIQNVDLFIYCSLIFVPIFRWLLHKYHNSCNTKRISSLEKSLSEKYVHIPGCQKNGAFHIGIQKNWAIHIPFVEKRGPIIYLAVLKKGAIRHAHPYYAIYRKLPPPTPEVPGKVNYVS